MYGIPLFLVYCIFKSLDNRGMRFALFAFRRRFLAVRHKETILKTKVGLKTVSCLVLQFAQFWNSFYSVFYNTGDLYGIGLFLGYCVFKFFENRSMILALFAFRTSFLAVFAEKNDSLDILLGLKTVFCLVFQFA